MKQHCIMKGTYVAPRAYASAAAPEGLICVSFNVVGLQVDELTNMNTFTEDESAECFDFEF